MYIAIVNFNLALEERIQFVILLWIYELWLHFKELHLFNTIKFDIFCHQNFMPMVFNLTTILLYCKAVNLNLISCTSLYFLLGCIVRCCYPKNRTEKCIYFTCISLLYLEALIQEYVWYLLLDNKSFFLCLLLSQRWKNGRFSSHSTLAICHAYWQHTLCFLNFAQCTYSKWIWPFLYDNKKICGYKM